MTLLDGTDTTATATTAGTPLPQAALEALFRTPRTAGTFADREVDDAVLTEAVELVRWGPTAFNASPLRLVAVRSAAARARLASHMAEGNRARVLAAPLTLVVAGDTDFHEHLPTLAPTMTGGRERFADQPELRERLARDNAWLQAGYLVTALRAVGLDVGPMSGMDAAGIDGDLLAGTSLRALMVLNVGWPAAEPAYRPRAARLDIADLVSTL